MTRALSLAAAQGNTEARANRDFVASQLDRESLANAQRRAAEFVPKKQGKALPTFYGVAGGKGSRNLSLTLLGEIETLRLRQDR